MPGCCDFEWKLIHGIGKSLEFDIAAAVISEKNSSLENMSPLSHFSPVSSSLVGNVGI